MLRKEGYAAYRAKFKEERPQYFIGDDRTVFRCLDSSLKREDCCMRSPQKGLKRRDNDFLHQSP